MDDANLSRMNKNDDVVAFELLLTCTDAAALERKAWRRKQTIGQAVRSLIRDYIRGNDPLRQPGAE
jgi:hypothetical protein